MPDHTPGHVWIVGAGPGDPGLFTLAGRAALRAADVVLYDALANPALLRAARPDTEFVYVGKRVGEQSMAQAEIEATMVAHARGGRQVVRLKGGDPFVFGRGGEEALACRSAGIPFTIVPGITSALGALAYAGIPVTHRGLASSFVVLTGSEPGETARAIDWEAAASIDTIVILMGLAALPELTAGLLAAGLAPSRPAACIRWGTRADQQVVRGTLADIAARVDEAGFASPVVTVVGEVAALADDLDWFAPGPLAGKRVVVTRARSQASDLVHRLEVLGAYVVEAPMISVRHLSDGLTTDGRVSSRWDWVAFTSANGVESFFAALAADHRDARSLATTQVAAVGEATSAVLTSAGILADFVPSAATSACLGAELPRVAGARILLPVSTLTDDSLAVALRRRGGLIEQVPVYQTVAEPLDGERLRAVAEAHIVTFTSASTAANLRAALGETPLAPEARLVSIGPRTSDAVRLAFGRVDAEAATPSLDALVASIQEVAAWAS